MTTARQCLALIPGERYREELRRVVDTGHRRERRVVVRKSSWNADRWTAEQRLALVYVDGEAEARWIAVERLEPPITGNRPGRARQKHARWMEEAQAVLTDGLAAGAR